MRRFVRVGILAVACVISTSSALADFWDVQRNLWTGEHDHFCGNTLISSSTTLNNADSLVYTNSAFPTNTGPLFYTGQWSSGDYWWAFGVFNDGSDGAVMNNTGTIQAIIPGNGPAQAVGIGSLQVSTITNWGTIDAQVQNNDGEAVGVWADSAGTTLVNYGTISARSPFSTVGVNTPNNVRIINNGTIQSIADAGTQGISVNQSFADGIGTGSGLNIPEYFENNGQLIAICTSTTATNQARTEAQWANGPTVFKNTGLIYCASFSSKGAGAQEFYYGAQSKDLTFLNSGLITNYCPGNGYALWMENDGDRGNICLNNSGTITSIGTSLLFLTGHWGPPGFLHTYYTNTGTFSGGQMRFYGIPATIYEAGQVHSTLFGLNGNSDVHVMGLPTIDPTLECGGNNSTLEFNLIGTLQLVNGGSANGTNLTALNLGQSGSIVVSGKTYRWSGAGNVSGMVNPGGYVPSPWLQQDVGFVGVAGGAVYCGGMFTVLASGSSIGNTADAFHFVYQSASNNCSIIAPVTVPRTTNPNGQAGVMIRNSLNANAANAFVGMTATNTVTFQYRSADGGGTVSNSATAVSTMHWVKLARSGSALTGYYSVDGTNWTQLGSTTINTGAANYMGLAFSGNNNSANGMATFYGVTCAGNLLAPSVPVGLTATAGIEQATLNWQASSNTASYNIGRSAVSGGPYTTVGNTSGTNYTDCNLPGRTTYYYVVTATTPGSQSTNSAQISVTPSANVPLPWAAQDLGPVGAVGNESYANGVFTVSAAGADIDNNQSYNVGVMDTCRFIYETNSGNCSIVARVTSVQNIDPESKAGVMIRSGLNSDAANVFVAMTPGIGVVMSCRSTASANATLINNVTNLASPCWVALVQNGTSFSGYYSADGNNWTLVGTTTASMTGSEYLGLTATSRDNWTLCTATFDNVSAPDWPVAAGPAGLTVTATPIGTARLTWNPLINATSYNVKRSLASGGPYTTIASNVARTNYTDLGAYSIADCYYVVSAVIGGNETANSSEAALHHFKLTGTIVGTPGSWGGSGNTIAKVFDNNLTTYFDGPDASGDWVGLYFGASVSNAITQINYCPRSGYEGRMVGGVFQGANQADFSDAVTLYTIATQPPSGTFTSVSITNAQAFRYVRYLSPTNGFCNVAELQFFGQVAGASVPPPAMPASIAATAISSSQVNLVWSDVTNATSYNVKRSTTNGVPYTIIATGVASNSYDDTGLADSTTYFYVVSGVNPSGESTNSVQASATTLPPAPASLTASAVSATQISLAWNAVSGATGYNVKRSIASGGPHTTIASGAAATSYTNAVVSGMKYYYVVSAVRSGEESLNSQEATVLLPYPWMTVDVGAVGVAGSAVCSNGVFAVNGAGADIQNTADAFRFTYLAATGNCTIIGRVASVQNIDAWSKAGVMIRESTNANAANAFIAVTPGNGVTWQNRSSTGGGTGYNNTGSLTAPYWVKLVRSGNTFTGYCSQDGATWTQQGQATFTTASTAYVGLALTSHNSSTLGTATFDNVTATSWPALAGTPVGLTATAGNTQATLTWTTSSNAASYNVKCATSNGGPYAIISNVTTTNCTTAGLTNGVTYYYVVSAVNLAGESADSSQISVTPLPPPSVSISLAGTNLTIWWPQANVGYTLQRRTNLISGDWMNVTSPAPQLVGSQLQIALPLSPDESSVFYRLLK